MTDKLFTIEEARAVLGEVATLVQELHDAHEVMDARHDEVTESIPTNGGGPVHRIFLDATLAAATALSTLDDMGIIVRDPSSGLIDFPSERDGKRVLLCWKLGETELAWWHPPETGFAGRMPL